MRAPGLRCHPRRLVWLAASLIVLASSALAPVRCAAQAASADEDEIRAAMIFNLAKFIDWPAWKLDAAHPDFQVCIVGSNPLGSSMDGLLQGKTVQGKPVVVRHLATLDATSVSCHILYLSSNLKRSADAFAADLSKNAVLTVSQRPNALSSRQIIGLPASEEHVHIEVNLAEAQRSGLTLSSRLLHLATVTY